MEKYLDLVKLVLNEGTRKENRTGVDTLSYFGAFFRHDLQAGFPLLTTKKVHTRSIFAELCWFLRGLTNIQYLKDHKVRIWDEWADENGETDAGYGEMWRAFPHHKIHSPYQVPESDKFDQMKWAVAELKKNPMSRRIVISAWLPPRATATKMAPCHYTFVFNVQNVKRQVCKGCGYAFKYSMNDALCGPKDCPQCKQYNAFEAVNRRELCLHWTQRSCDISLGVPFNIASYAALTHIIAKEVGLPVGTLAGTFVDLHAYTAKPDGSMEDHDHVPGLCNQVIRQPRCLPTLRIAGNNPWDCVCPEDLIVEGYSPHPPIPFKVAV